MGVWKIIMLFMMLVSPLAASISDKYDGVGWFQFDPRPTKIKLKDYIGQVRVSLNALRNDDVDENDKLEIKRAVESVVQWMEKNPNATYYQYAGKQMELMEVVYDSKKFQTVFGLDSLISFSKHYMNDCQEFDPKLKEEIERKLDAVEEWVFSHGYKIDIYDTSKAYEAWRDIDDAYVQKYREVDILAEIVFDNFFYFLDKTFMESKGSTNSILFR